MSPAEVGISSPWVNAMLATPLLLTAVAAMLAYREQVRRACLAPRAGSHELVLQFFLRPLHRGALLDIRSTG